MDFGMILMNFELVRGLSLSWLAQIMSRTSDNAQGSKGLGERVLIRLARERGRGDEFGARRGSKS